MLQRLIRWLIKLDSSTIIKIKKRIRKILIRKILIIINIRTIIIIIKKWVIIIIN